MPEQGEGGEGSVGGDYAYAIHQLQSYFFSDYKKGNGSLKNRQTCSKWGGINKLQKVAKAGKVGWGEGGFNLEIVSL